MLGQPKTTPTHFARYLSFLRGDGLARRLIEIIRVLLSQH